MPRSVLVCLCVLLVAWCGLSGAEEPGNFLTFDPSDTAFVAASGERIAQHVTGPDHYRSGAAVLTLRYLDIRTLGRGIYLGSIDEAKNLSWMPSDQYTTSIKSDEPGVPLVVFLPYAGWRTDALYAIRVKPTVLDLLGRPAVEDETTWVFSVKRGADDSTELNAQVVTRKVGATHTVDVAIPGGQDLLFQGAWTDPVTGLAYHRGRWYDPRTGSFVSPDPEGDIDSVNQHAFVAHRPHAATDPLGTHTRRSFEVNGTAISAYSPTLEEIQKAQLAFAYSYDVNGKMVGQICDQQCGLTWTMYAKVFPDSIFSESWEAFYGQPIASVEESLLKLYGRAMWDIKEEAALSAFFSMVPVVAEAGPATKVAARSAPRVNLLNTRVASNVSVQELNALAEANAVARQAAAGATAAPTSQLVPGGGLAAHEAAGGHLLARHVGQSEAQLATRLVAQPRIPAASTFLTRTEAEAGVSVVLDANAAQVSSWISSGAQGQIVIRGPFSGGLVLQRGAASATSGSEVVVVLRGTGGGAWRIVTGYPVP